MPKCPKCSKTLTANYCMNCNADAPKGPLKETPKTIPTMGASGFYGLGVRAQVFEIIVRQALAGAPWREICAGPMQVNNISPEEVAEEVRRRQQRLRGD